MRRIFIFFLLCSLLSSVASAHPGRTDANGGHWDRSTGEYHFHTGEYSGRSSSGDSSNYSYDYFEPPYDPPTENPYKETTPTKKSASEEDKPNFVVRFFSIFLGIIGVIYVLVWFYALLIEPIISFFIKMFMSLIKYFKKIFFPACKQCSKLEDECDRLKAELMKSEDIRTKAAISYRRELSNQKELFNKESGKIVKAEFDDIILSFIDSKPLAPNVSIEHLTRLCDVPEANDRFFRALLQEFEIESLRIDKTGDGKRDIKIKLKSGKNTYETTLDDCSCGDFYRVNGHKVCKHMYFLALTLGLISSEHYKNFQKYALALPDKEKVKALKKNNK